MQNYGNGNFNSTQSVVKKGGATNGGNGQDSSKNVGGSGFVPAVTGRDTPVVVSTGATNNGKSRA